jgi:hypothetical protein
MSEFYPAPFSRISKNTFLDLAKGAMVNCRLARRQERGQYLTSLGDAVLWQVCGATK